ncbi:MAG: hypothetical protein WB696_25650, partial [Chthoniobacterales bacterium]
EQSTPGYDLETWVVSWRRKQRPSERWAFGDGRPRQPLTAKPRLRTIMWRLRLGLIKTHRFGGIN